MPYARRLRPSLAALLLSASLSPGLVFGSGEPTPFTARYHLELRGWPDATIDHRLVREGHHWLNELRASLALTRGDERSRFVIVGDDVQPLFYTSGYSLMGLGKRYQIAPDALHERPDRLTALFMLSRQAAAGECHDTCRLDYQDHQGEQETLEYRVRERAPLSVPAGDFEALTVEARHPDEPDRHLVLRFHPELPGLLLSADYHRDGERRSRLLLTALERPQP